MIDLTREKFYTEFYEKRRNNKSMLVLSCYKDLFEGDNQHEPRYIAECIEVETKVLINRQLVYYIRKHKEKIECYYNPLWRTYGSNFTIHYKSSELSSFNKKEPKG